MEKKKISFIHSILGKIVLTIIAIVLCCTVVNLAVVIPNVQKLIKNQTKNYIYDTTILYGEKLSLKYSSLGEAALRYTITSAFFENAGLQDVKSSYVYIVGEDGTMLYHPTQEKIGQPVENSVVKGLVERIGNGDIPEAEVVEYQYKGKTKYAGSYVQSEGKFILVLTADEDEIFEPMQKMVTKLIVASVIMLILASVAGILIILRITNALQKITEIVNQFADMDFREGKDEELLAKRKDESGEMSRSVRKLRGRLTGVVGSLQEQATQLYQASGNLTVNASETVRTTEQVEQAVQGIADGATNQATETQQATKHVMAMGEMVVNTAREVDLLHSAMEEMDRVGGDASKKLRHLEEINTTAKSALDAIYAQTNTTNQSALKIQEVIGIIAEIAEETNLLSLNASIEAARAGEQGRGFAVVAAQIQKLAEQSNESAGKIEEIVNYLISDSRQSVETMDEVKGIMDEQISFVADAANIFSLLQKKIAESVEKIEQISAGTEDLDEERRGVVDVVQNLTAISEENAATTEQTSASVVAVGDIMTQVSENATSLKEIAARLEEAMKQFVIE